MSTEPKYFTPNDPFDWRAGCKTVVHDTHALRTLTKQKNDIQTTLGEPRSINWRSWARCLRN